MKRSTNQCLETKRLVRLIHEQFDERDETEIVAHIDQCSKCQAALERAAGGDEIWDELQSHLTQELCTGEASTGETQTPGKSRAEIELQKLQSYLGPTDDPRYLGRLGNYEVCGLIGQGSTGIVVKAFEPRLSRYVAIKILSPAYSSNGPARVRFERESRSVAAVAHEHVVPIYAVDEFRDLPYIVMQYIPGGSLQQRIDRDGPLDTCGVVRLGMQIAKGLSAAHAQGIVHRDVKPANVLLENKIDRAMVSDFGLARVADDAAMTRSGVIAGTPQYMSPEQAKGNPIDQRSDLFSLGSVMYAAATGRPPFRAETVFGVIQRVCESEPVPVREINPKVERWLEAFINKLHSKNREDRFASADQIVEILGGELAHLQGPSTVAAPERPWFRPVETKKVGWTVAIALSTLFVVASVIAVASGFFKSNDPGNGEFAAFIQEDSKKDKPRPALGPNEKKASELNASLPGKPGKFVKVAKKYPGGIIDGYMLYLPKSFDAASNKPYPVIMFLQGGQAVGGKIESVASDGLPEILKNDLWKESEFEFARFIKDTFIVVCPHMIKGKFDERQFYDQEKAIAAIRKEMIENYRGDDSRVYLAGAGRGGHGTWGLASRMPNAFAAYVAVSGERRGIVNHAVMAELPIWAAHDKRDPCVEYEVTLDSVGELEHMKNCEFKRVHMDDIDEFDVANRKKVFVTLDCGSGSASIFRDRKVYDWMLQYKIDSTTRKKIAAATRKHQEMVKAMSSQLTQLQEDEKRNRDLRNRLIDDFLKNNKSVSDKEVNRIIKIRAGEFGISADRYVSLIVDRRKLSARDFHKLVKAELTVKKMKKSDPEKFEKEVSKLKAKLKPETSKAYNESVTPWSDRKSTQEDDIKSAPNTKNKKNQPNHDDLPVHEDTISKKFDASPGGKLVVDVGQGSVKLMVGSNDKIAVKVHREVRAEDEEKAKELFKEHRVEFSTKSDDADLKIESRWSKEFLESKQNQFFKNIKYEITLPKKYHANLKTAGGMIEIEELQGNLDANTSGGSIQMGKIDGVVKAHTSGGRVVLAGCTDNATLNTSGGSIDVGNVDKNLSAKTSGGRIQAGKIAGDLVANTTGGSVKVESAGGKIDVETGGGSIQLQLPKQPAKDIFLKTGAGSIKVGMKNGINLKVQAATGVGSISGPFIKKSRDTRGAKSFRGSIGSDGPKLKATNGAGSIKFYYLEDTKKN